MVKRASRDRQTHVTLTNQENVVLEQEPQVSLLPAGKAAVLMLRARALKAARARSKAAAKAAKAAAEAAANSGSPDIIAANTHSNNDVNASVVPEVDALTFVHQRAVAAAATLVQVSDAAGELQQEEKNKRMK